MKACMTFNADNTVTVADDVEVSFDDETDRVTFLRDGVFQASITGPAGLRGHERSICESVREALERS